MSDFEIVLKGILKILYNFRLAVIFIPIYIIFIRRWERLENERIQKIIDRKNSKRVHHQANDF